MTEPSQSNTTDSIALIEVNNLKKTFPGTRGVFSRTRTGDVKAVQNVSFDVKKGETLGLVGESGCGKSTIGRCILKLEEPTDGTVQFDGKRLNTINGMDLRNYRRRAQAVFQDPWSSLNPRIRVKHIISEPMVVNWSLSKNEINERE